MSITCHFAGAGMRLLQDRGQVTVGQAKASALSDAVGCLPLGTADGRWSDGGILVPSAVASGYRRRACPNATDSR